MVKIERLYDGAKGTFVREGVRVPFFQNQLLSLSEYDTLEITQGRVLVSINEEVLVELPQPGQQLTLNISETAQTPAEEIVVEIKSLESAAPVEPASEAPQEAPQVKAPVIVQPPKRKK